MLVMPMQATREKKPFLRRIPTSLIVTLVGIALSAWLLPALSHQWDDRQKAAEIKAGLIADIAAASAPPLGLGEVIWTAPPPVRKQQEVLNEWTVASREIETRLTTYFDRKLVRAWEIYTWLVTRFDNALTGTANAALNTATNSRKVRTTSAAQNRSAVLQLDPDVALTIAYILGMSKLEVPNGPHFEVNPSPDRGTSWEGEAFSILTSYLAPFSKQLLYDPLYGIQDAEEQLLRLQGAIAREISKAHTAGYSTSAHDFLRSLIP